jgi:hypothetical protein
VVARRLLLLLLAITLCACDEDTADAESSEGALSPSAAPFGSVEQVPGGIVLPPEAQPVVNPFDLPAPTDQPEPEKGQRVFAVPQRMLASAKLGSAMKLASATARGREGQNYLVRIGFGAPYQIHPAYVVVPRPGRFRRGTYVIASYSGELKHGVVTHLVRDRVAVRYTDLGRKTSEQKLDPKRIGVLPSGLAPGGYAAHLTEHEYRHVLLVSSSMAAGKRRWLVIGHTGETALVSEDKLQPLPVPRFKPKVGATVLAAWRGTLVRTQVKSLDRPALLTVTRPRAGWPLVVGPGMVMPTD